MQRPYEHNSKVHNYLIFSGLCGQFLGADLSANIDYQGVSIAKAMLMFYEQNNIAAFKQIFIEQYEIAVKNYF